MRSWRTALLTALLLLSGAAIAGGLPVPPCGGVPEPPYPAPGATPSATIFRPEGDPASWPPPCVGWSAPPSTPLLALAASFRFAGGADELLERIGAISALRGIVYWSVTDKAWRVLVTDAAALSGPEPAQRRADFAIAEINRGADLHFLQGDSRSSGPVVYRMRMREGGPDRIVMELENVSTVRALLMPLFGPGDLRTTYFLDRIGGDVWGYYALSTIGRSAATPGGRGAASYVNRSVALYRHIAGIKTDAGPPPAP